MGYETVKADFLIIGGGTAGTMAAVRAKELNPDANVVIFEKGHIRRSGSIAMGMDAMNIVAVPGGDTAKDYVEANTKACYGILDAKPSYVMADRSYDMVKRLESWGVHFPKDENGDYERVKVHPNGNFCLTMPDPDLKIRLVNKVEEHNVTVYNRTMVTSLLVNGDRVVGATGLNTRTGEYILCEAKAVLVCNGGASRFGIPNTGALYGTYDYPGNAGDGYSLAYRAGADLTGFEYCMQMSLIKDINVPITYVSKSRGAKVYTALGDELDMGDTVNLEMMVQAYRDGKGPLFIKMQHLPEEQIKHIENILFKVERPMMERFMEGRGMDFRKDDIELNPTEIYLCGGHGLTGIVVNEKAETSLKGLYAAGDVSNVSRGHLTGAFVFGEIAGEQAQNWFDSEVEIDREQVEREFKKIDELKKLQDNEVPVEQVEYKLRRVINDYLPSPKSEYRISKGLDNIRVIKDELKEVMKVTDNNELARAIEVGFIADCAELCAVASLNRKESRWSERHYRVDYPEMDDENWLKHVVLSRGDKEGEIKVELRPIDYNL
ncbi:MAG: fumarate reductase/succinate dehydrogenase flavoprotein subunit [Firmicutes bacterium]|nr:fumarate reductase/succinate dehydrogenase flavoprotein subunit [Bacillota bacterium]